MTDNLNRTLGPACRFKWTLVARYRNRSRCANPEGPVNPGNCKGGLAGRALSSRDFFPLECVDWKLGDRPWFVFFDRPNVHGNTERDLWSHFPSHLRALRRLGVRRLYAERLGSPGGGWLGRDHSGRHRNSGNCRRILDGASLARCCRRRQPVFTEC